eukprot:CAMPEP_0174748388 /NCGR_PEP_ID=MMETSP1094-20130205/93349_1 /TAXON_ID=156173 /ORGANISM="Chrysochromulina brevifilum, Strain UTEX LB 985" /LENGTH=71 /DNA_ID=CAMNT_0015953413 /DNA_START=101 /DNA_END=316 /DNA_ORIENTATION=+
MIHPHTSSFSLRNLSTGSTSSTTFRATSCDDLRACLPSAPSAATFDTPEPSPSPLVVALLPPAAPPLLASL